MCIKHFSIQSNVNNYSYSDYFLDYDQCDKAIDFAFIIIFFCFFVSVYIYILLVYNFQL